MSAPGFVALLASSYSMPASRAIARALRNSLGAQRTTVAHACMRLHGFVARLAGACSTPLAQECLRPRLDSSHALPAPTRCPLAAPLHLHCAMPSGHNARQP